MVITLIVVALSFSVLNMVNKQVQAVSYQYALNHEIKELKTALSLDFLNHSEVILVDNSQIIFKSPVSKKEYNHHGLVITREQDSFNIPVKQVVAWLKGKPVTAGKIDAVEIEYEYADIVSKLFVYRSNSCLDNF